jgi:UDP-GlcNAc:undecaprenyl-phosphate GlcNAc-1-phosphate transferase
MISLAIPVLIIGLPIFDVAFAIVRRLAKKTSLAGRDTSHLHYRLIGMGLTHRQSVVLLYITSAVLGLCGFVFANKNYISAAILLILLPVFVFAYAKYLIGDKNTPENGDRSGGADDFAMRYEGGGSENSTSVDGIDGRKA